MILLPISVAWLQCARVQAYWLQHYTCPFGAVSSVHAWERVGAALAHLARVFLHLPVFRYVDDYFGPDRHVISAQWCAVSQLRMVSGVKQWRTASHVSRDWYA